MSFQRLESPADLQTYRAMMRISPSPLAEIYFLNSFGAIEVVNAANNVISWLRLLVSALVKTFLRWDLMVDTFVQL